MYTNTNKSNFISHLKQICCEANLKTSFQDNARIDLRRELVAYNGMLKYGSEQEAWWDLYDFAKNASIILMGNALMQQW